MDKTIDMAREAGVYKDCDWRYGMKAEGDSLKAFEALIRADEREKYKWDVHSCGPTCKRYGCVAMREAVEAEREACAKVCEDMAKGYEERNARPKEDRDINPEVARIASMTCAFVGDAIRARGNT
jgi:hypothetical protein